MLHYLAPYVPLIIATIALSFVVVTSESLSLWFSVLINAIFKPESITTVKPSFSLHNFNDILKYWTYLLIKRDNPFDSLKLACVLVVVFFLMKNVFSYIKSLLTSNLNFFISRDMRDHLYGHALLLPVTYYDRNRSGNIISLMFNDISAVNNSLTGTIEKLITDPFRLVFFIAILLIINLKLTLLVFAIYPVLGICITQIGRTVRRRSRRALERISGLVSIMNETVQCIRAVKMFNMSEPEIRKFKEENQKFSMTLFRARHIQLSVEPPHRDARRAHGGLTLMVRRPGRPHGEELHRGRFPAVSRVSVHNVPADKVALFCQ